MNVHTGGKEGNIKVREAVNGKELKTIQAHAEGVSVMAYSADGSWLATGNDHEARLWDAGTLELRHTLARPAAWLAFAPDGKTLLTARHDHRAGTTHTVYRWDVSSGRQLSPMPLATRGGFAVYHLGVGALYAMGAQPPDPRLFAYAPATGQRHPQPQGHTGPVLAVAIHPDGRTIASGGADHLIHLWDAATGEHVRSLSLQSGVTSVKFSPDGRVLAS